MSNEKRHLFRLVLINLTLSVNWKRFGKLHDICNTLITTTASDKKYLHPIVPDSKGFSFIDNFKLKIVFTNLAMPC